MKRTIQEFSLLAPEQAAQYSVLSESTANDLSIDFLTAHLSESEAERRILKNFLLRMPTDAHIIAYRQAVYLDLKQNPGFCDAMMEIFDSIRFSAMDDFRTNTSKAGIWELIHRVRVLEQYCNAIAQLQALLTDKHFSSTGMQQFAAFIQSIYQNSGFAELSEDIQILRDDILNIKSMTLGVNLNSEFAPAEIGIVSLNPYVFREKGFLEKFLQFHRNQHLEDKELTPFTMLSHAGNGTASESLLMNNLTSLVEEMLPVVTVKLRRVLKRYTDISGIALAQLADELLFYSRMIGLERKLLRAGLPCCMVTCSQGETHLTDCYNLRLALCQLDGTVQNPIVCNPLDFTQEHTILILTGPNQGGKTILTQGIGLLFLLVQHGMFAPCSGGCLRICDGIYTHFPADENQTVSFGRLGEEAVRFREICNLATKDTLLLFNESFATTSHTESLYIAENALKYLCCLGARTCFNTHMHELAANPAALQTEHSVCGAVSVVMGRRDSAEAYRIRYEAPEGLSYADAIARQYGITFEQLCREHLQRASVQYEKKSVSS